MKLFCLVFALVLASCCRAATPEFVGPVMHWLYDEGSPSKSEYVAAGKAAMKARRAPLVHVRFGSQKFIFDVRSGELKPTDKSLEEFAAAQKIPADPKSPERKFSFVEIAGPNDRASLTINVGSSICHGYEGILRWDAEKKVVLQESFIVKSCP